MTIDRGDLSFELGKLQEQLDAIQRHQMLANSRIRQDLASVVVAIGVTGLVLVILLMHWPTWLIVPVAVIGQPALQAYLVRHVQEREEP